jgi:hypothetical protein
MKKILGTVGVVAGALIFAASANASVLSQTKSAETTLKGVSAVEMPAQAAAFVDSAAPQDKRDAVLGAIKAVDALNKSASASVLASLIKANPDFAADAAVVAVAENPKKAQDILEVATKAAPGKAVEIAKAVSAGYPKIARKIAADVASVLPKSDSHYSESFAALSAIQNSAVAPMLTVANAGVVLPPDFTIIIVIDITLVFNQPTQIETFVTVSPVGNGVIVLLNVQGAGGAVGETQH